MDSLLLVFAKTPIAGTIKTRLAKRIGAEKALWIYNQLLKKTAVTLKEISPKVVVFYSGEHPNYFEPYFSAHKKIPQQGFDLGERMEGAFQWGFDEGFKKIIVIGTDLWEVNDSLLKKAFEKLETHDYVIGPALDGGYYLLGMKTCTPSLFKNKKWSSETVLAATLSDLNENTVFLLEEKNDIDTLEDLKNMPELYQGLKLKFNDRKE